MKRNHPTAVPAIERKHKTLEGLQGVVTDALNRPLKQDGADLTLRIAILLAITYYRATPAEAMQLRQVAKQIAAASDACTLTVEDHAALRAAIEKNPVNWGAITFAQVCEGVA